MKTPEQFNQENAARASDFDTLKARHTKALEAVRLMREALTRVVGMVRGDPGEGGITAVAEMVNSALVASAEVVNWKPLLLVLAVLSSACQGVLPDLGGTYKGTLVMSSSCISETQRLGTITFADTALPYRWEAAFSAQYQGAAFGVGDWNFDLRGSYVDADRDASFKPKTLAFTTNSSDVFIDPYKLQVTGATFESLAQTDDKLKLRATVFVSFIPNRSNLTSCGNVSAVAEMVKQ